MPDRPCSSWRGLALLAPTVLACAVLAAAASPGPFDKRWARIDPAAFANPGNWAPFGVPLPADVVVIDGTFGATTPVLLLAGDQEQLRALVEDVDATVDFGPAPPGTTWDLTGTPALEVAGTPGGSASLRVRGGIVSAIETVVGFAAGAAGSVELEGPLTQLASVSTVLGANGGTGTLALVGGAQATVGILELGTDCLEPAGSPSIGRLEVDGTLEVIAPVSLARGSVQLKQDGTLVLGVPGIACPGVTIGGDGTIDVVSFDLAGHLDAGRPPAPLGPPAGDLVFTGDLRLQAVGPDGLERAGRVTVRRHGPACGSTSTVAVGGVLELAGTLVLDLAPTCDPASVSSLVAITAGSITGTPDLAAVVGAGPETQLQVLVDPGTGPAGGSVLLLVSGAGSVAGLVPLSSTPLGGIPVDLVIDDLDGTGGLDLAIAVVDEVDPSIGRVSVLLGNASGTGFAAPVDYPLFAPPSGLDAGRLDGDGDVDLVVVTEGGQGPLPLGAANAFVLDNDGSGTFATVPIGVGPLGLMDPTDVAVANFNDPEQQAPGVADVVIVDGGADVAYVLQNDGAGGFTALAPIILPLLPRPVRVDPADLDDEKDGFGWDLAFASQDGGAVSVYRNDGSADLFADVADRIDLAVDEGPTDVIARDLGGDGGPLELVIRGGGVEDDGVIAVASPDGAGGYRAAASVPVVLGADDRRRPTWLDAADLDDDGDLDVLLVSDDGNDTDSNVLLLRNDSAGGTVVLAPAEEIDPGPAAALVKGEDLDGDGDAEVVVVDRSSGAGPGLPVVEVLGDPAPADPADLDGDGSVGFGDLLVVLSSFGPCSDPADCPADLDGSGDVGFADLLVVLSSWG